MAAKSRLRKPALEVPVVTEDAADALPAAKPKKKLSAPRKKKLEPPVASAPTGRIITEQERMAALDSLPSLKSAPRAAENAAVTVIADSAQPPVAVPVLDSEPIASAGADRGLPIPTHYGMDRLVILSRDANWLFTYWELKGGALERLRFQHSGEAIDNARWVLRVQNLSASIQQLVDIDLRIGQWYLKVPAETEFAIDLGFVDMQGTFCRVLQGNVVQTPRPAVSDLVDERWLVLREELEKLLLVSGAENPQAVSRSGSLAGAARSDLPRAIGLFSAVLGRGPK